MTNYVIVLFTFVRKMPLDEVPVSYCRVSGLWNIPDLVGVNVAFPFPETNPVLVMICC